MRGKNTYFFSIPQPDRSFLRRAGMSECGIPTGEVLLAIPTTDTILKSGRIIRIAFLPGTGDQSTGKPNGDKPDILPSVYS